LPRGAAFYQFDTSFDSNGQSGNCLGDQPKVGFNNNALVVSTDQFCGPTLSDFQGALVFAISKPQLVAEAATVNDAILGPIAWERPDHRGRPGDRHRHRHRVSGELVPV
jgi:hypothetical protein